MSNMHRALSNRSAESEGVAAEDWDFRASFAETVVNQNSASWNGVMNWRVRGRLEAQRVKAATGAPATVAHMDLALSLTDEHEHVALLLEVRARQQ